MPNVIPLYKDKNKDWKKKMKRLKRWICLIVISCLGFTGCRSVRVFPDSWMDASGPDLEGRKVKTLAEVIF